MTIRKCAMPGCNNNVIVASNMSEQTKCDKCRKAERMIREQCKGCPDENKPITAIPCNECNRVHEHGLDWYRSLKTFSDGKI